MTSARSRPIALAVASIAIAVLIFHVRRYPVLTHDDAFISLRYVERFLNGQGLTWTEGQPVEGYSNLLWILGCSLLAVLGVGLLHTPVLLGVASAIAIIAALVYAFPAQSWRESLPSWAGAMFVALAGPIGLWAVAGLEGCLFGALVAWSLVLLYPLVSAEQVDSRGALLAGVPLALLCLTRPDGPLFVVVACGFLLLRTRSTKAAWLAITVGLLPAVAFVGQLAFRLSYYGDWVPNTARVKVAFAAARVQSGAMCVAEAGQSSYALWVPAILALFVAWRERERRARIMLAFALLVAWTLYAVTIVCEPYGFRMLIPCYVVLAFLVAEVLDWVQRGSRPTPMIAWGSTLGLLAWFGVAQQAERSIVLARTERPPVTMKGATIGSSLRSAFGGQDPLLAVDAAGAIPFFAEMRALDMLGLNDAHIARSQGEPFGSGTQGHELGDGAYVLAQSPDLIVSKRLGVGHLAFVGGREMESNPRFKESYRRIRMRGQYPVPWAFYVFARLESPVGIRRSERLIEIPGYLFAGRRGTEAHVDDEGMLGVRFLHGTEAVLEGIQISAGRWRFVGVGTGAFRLSALADSPMHLERTDHGLDLVLTRQARVDLSVLAGASSFLTRVTARRLDE